MRITTEMLLNPEHGTGISQGDLEGAIFILEEATKGIPETGSVVIPFDDVPEPVRKVFNWNGGDEDWLVVTRKEPEYLPPWIERLDSCHEPDVYVLDNLVVYVGSHA